MTFASMRAALLGGAVAAVYLLPTSASAQMLKFSYPVASDNPMGLAIEHFAGLVDEATGGAVTVRGFPDAQLGNEIQTVTAAQGGTIEMGVTSTAGLAGTFPDLNVFNMPFVINNDKELDAVKAGPTAQKLLDGMSVNNLHGLCIWDYGFRNLTNNKRPLETVEDMAGLRVRMIQNSVYLETFEALGVVPAPLAFPETFSALETGAIDGNEISNAVTRSSSFYEVQKYLTETRHFPTAAVVYMSQRAWEGLPSEHQAAIEQACDDTVAFNRETNQRLEAETRDFLIEKGMEISELKSGELEKIQATVSPVVEKVSASITPEIRDTFFSELEAARQ